MKRFPIVCDPIEDDPRLRRVVAKARRQAELELDDWPEGMGYCFVLWGEMKRILREEHGIDWRTPGEMNPNVLFD
jgi:hypothetical protein